MAQRLKRSPARQETWVQSLGQEDPLEKEMATHSSILAWKIPWREESRQREIDILILSVYSSWKVIKWCDGSSQEDVK